MTKILLVEDDKALREIYGVRLLAEGYDIVSAGDGEEALAVVMREKPALIISDVMMPKISGFEMLDLLRNNEATRNVKVIMMTALSGDQHRERGENLGADRYLVKSQVGIEDVVNTVHEVLGDKSQPAAASDSPTVAPAQTPAPSAAPPVPATPAPNQSPVNPPVATSPSTAAGVPAPNMPPVPPSVPVVTTANVPDTPPAPPITAVPDMPPVPTPAVNAPSLPPIAPPSDGVIPEPTLPPPNMVPPAGNVSPAPTPAPPAPLNAPAPAPNPPAPSANSSLPPAGLNNASPDDGAAPYKPSVDLAQSGSHIGTRVIQPTGESLSPKVDMGNLIANEEAKDTMTGPVAAVQTPPDSSPPTTPAEVQVNSTGAINLDSLPASPAGDPATFPNQSQ